MKKLIAWVEIPTENIKRAVDFYNSIFDFKMEVLDFGSEKMACLPNDEGAIIEAKGFKPSDQGVLVSLNVEDLLDEVLSKIVKAGGKIVKAKTKIEAENRDYFALFTDTEGNRLGLYGK